MELHDKGPNHIFQKNKKGEAVSPLLFSEDASQ